MGARLVGIATFALLATATIRGQLPGRCEEPAAARKSDIGCYVAATTDVGILPDGPIYWHIYEFATRAQAESIQAPVSTIIEAFNRVYLYALTAQPWQPPSGKRVAVVGPLPHTAGLKYTARYLEGTVPAGQKTPIHTHPGPEAWYVVDGAQCLETPDQVLLARAGDSSIVKPDVPMVLSSVGSETRHSLALVLHDSAHPWTHVTPDGWKPAGGCPK